MMTAPKTKKLKNGMTVVMVPQKGATSCTLFVMVRVGSRYETKRMNGASHFVEHLMFKGTKRRPTSHILTQTLDRYGAEYNAFTGKDVTAYYVKIDAAHAALAADLLHDMVFHSRFEPKEINKERGVILEEINMYEDNPLMHVEDLLEEALFPDSTLGWNIAGPREVIRNITPKQLVDYRDAYYVPERVTVVMTGKIPAGLREDVASRFGAVAAKRTGEDAPYGRFCPPLALAKPVRLQKKETEQVQLGIGFHSVPIGHEHTPAAKLLANILGGSMSSRLFTEIREKRGLCYTIRAQHDPFEDTGIFSITAGLDKTRIGDAAEAILGELARIAKTTVGKSELTRAKDNMRGRLMLAFEDSAAQAEWYARQWTFMKELKTPEEQLRDIDRVTAATLRDVAAGILSAPHMAVAAIGPLKDEASLARHFNLSRG